MQHMCYFTHEMLLRLKADNNGILGLLLLTAAALNPNTTAAKTPAVIWPVRHFLLMRSNKTSQSQRQIQVTRRFKQQLEL